MMVLIVSTGSQNFAKIQFLLTTSLLLSALANGVKPTLALMGVDRQIVGNRFDRFYLNPINLFFLASILISIFDIGNGGKIMKLNHIDPANPIIGYVVWILLMMANAHISILTNQIMSAGLYRELIIIFACRTIFSSIGLTLVLGATDSSSFAAIFLTASDFILWRLLQSLSKFKNKLHGTLVKETKNQSLVPETLHLLGWIVNGLIILSAWFLNRTIFSFGDDGVSYTIYILLVRMLNVATFGYSSILQVKIANLQKRYFYTDQVDFLEPLRVNRVRNFFCFIIFFTLTFIDIKYAKSLEEEDLVVINISYLFFSVASVYNSYSSFWLLARTRFKQWIIGDFLLAFGLLSSTCVISILHINNLSLAIFLSACSYMYSLVYTKNCLRRVTK